MKEYCLQYEDNEKEITPITFDYIHTSFNHANDTTSFDFYYKGKEVAVISFSSLFSDDYFCKKEQRWK
jgi:hypothetical protein